MKARTLASEGRKRLGLIMILAGAVIPLAIASTAWACARLSVIKLNAGQASPGAQVFGVGRNFDPPSRGSTPVTIRFNSRSGAPLTQATPNAEGRISFSFRVPNAPRGGYAILATQTTREGRPAAGTPARAPLRVRGASGSRRARRGEIVAPVGGSASSGGGPTPAPVAAGGLALALSGGGVFLLLGARRGQSGLAA